MKKFRQGQTVYEVRLNIEKGFRYASYEITRYFLYSQKEPLPPEGCIIDRMPVNLMNRFAKEFPDTFLTRSRSKAISKQKQLRLSYER